MKLYDVSILIIIIVIGISAIVGAISYEFLGPTNPFTLEVEKVLEIEAGDLLAIPINPSAIKIIKK